MKKHFDFLMAIVVTILLYKFMSPGYGNLFLLVYFLFKVYITRFRLFAIIGRSKFDKNQEDAAIHWFEKAIKIRGCSGGIKASYAYLLLIMEKVDMAYEVMKNATVSDPREIVTFEITKAIVLWKKDLRAEAMETLEKLNEDKKSSTVYECLGYYYLINGDTEKALAFNTEAFEYDDKNPAIRDNLAHTYFMLNDYDIALKMYEPLLEENTTLLDTYYYAAKILFSKGSKEHALHLLEHALELKDTFMSELHISDIENLYNELKDSNIEPTPALETASDTSSTEEIIPISDPVPATDADIEQ